MAAYATSMTAIDPSMGQIVEVPIDQAGSYIIQDGNLISTNQLPLSGIQAGKSLLKPELAQHLNQHAGYKANVGRGGFTVGGADARWASITANRGGRNIARKPVNHGTSGLTQSTLMTPAASGLLSLGTRYTPSSVTAFGTGAGSMPGTGGVNNSGSGMIVPASASGNIVSANVGSLGGMGVDRDTGYRLAAAIAGSSGRGRPRGRRPLRGQFPVVPIDMVRQLGIEQQVILQPAAPVAMRNKAVLCRPLSVCRKTQANVVSYENANQPGVAVQTEEIAGDSSKREKDIQNKDMGTDPDDDMLFNKNELEKTETSCVETSTLDYVSFAESDTQTDVCKEERKFPLVLPIPIPVPIYVPCPVYLYAKPVPYAFPFPLPCPIPLPLVIKDDQSISTPDEKESEISINSDAVNIMHTEQVDVSDDKTQISKPTRTTNESQSGLKRAVPTKSPDTSESIKGSNVLETRSDWNSVHQSEAKRLRPTLTPILTSDTDYHLKFSYGINAWRHWVQQKLANESNKVNQQHLYTDLLNMDDKDLNMALSQFVREVRKPNNECYVADSIFYLCLGIQEYLNENGRSVNIFGGSAFTNLSRALDDILANFQPRISAEGLLICRIEEEHLWEAKQLGANSPEVLLFTMLYFNTKHFGLRLGTVHRQLAFCHFHATESAIICNLPSQIFNEHSESMATTLRLDMNNEQHERCPVRLFKIYISKCPRELKNSGKMFYLLPSYPQQSNTWYSTTAVEPSDLQVMLNRIKMVKEIQEAFMNGQLDGGF